MFYIKIQPHALTTERAKDVNSSVSISCSISSKSDNSTTSKSVSLTFGSYTETSIDGEDVLLSFTGSITSASSSTYKLKRLCCDGKQKFGDGYVTCIGKVSSTSDLSEISLDQYLENATSSDDALIVDVYIYVDTLKKTLRYDANGGTFSTEPSDQEFTLGSAITLTSTSPTKSGSTFWGWCIPGVQNKRYSSGATISAADSASYITGNVTLFAMWTTTDWTDDQYVGSLVYKPI